MKHKRYTRALTLDDTVIGAAAAKQIAGSSPKRCRVIISTPPDATTYTVAFGQDATATRGFWLSANRPWLDFAREEYGEWIGQSISVFSTAGGTISIGQVMEYEEECDCPNGQDHYHNA